MEDGPVLHSVTSMRLRLHLPSSRPPPRWSLVVLACAVAAVLLLGRPTTTADAGVGNYTTLYPSGATSTILSASDTLVTAAGPGQPAKPTATPTGTGPLTSGTYNYADTVVDPTGGETAVSQTSLSVTTANGKSVQVGNLPTGVNVWIYRQLGNGFFTRVAELPNNSSATYTDSMDNATAASQPVLAQAQNRVPIGTLMSAPPPEYDDFSPGVYAPLSGTFGQDTNSLTTPNGKGWIVDGEGGVSFAAGTWTFQARFIAPDNPARGTAHMTVGMWKVTVSGNAITGSTLLVDPSCSGAVPCGESGTNFVGGTVASPKLVSVAVSLAAFSLQSNQHLYVEYFRHQTSGMTQGAGLGTMLAYDGTNSSITLPAATPMPDAPAIVSPSPADGARSSVAAPTLAARYYESDGNSGTVTFRLCTDASCSTTYGSPYTTSSLASGSTGTWSPGTLPDGTYYWEATATDSLGNASDPPASTIRSFTVDTTAPSAPPLVSPTAGLRTNNTTPTLTATYSDTPAGGTGTLSFQLCRQMPLPVTCSGPGTASGVANGANGSWTPSSLPDGTYTWQVQATDEAGNVSSWSSTRSFVVDTNPPLLTSFSGPSDGALLRTLPSLSGKWGANGDSGDSGTINAQLCSDNTCNTVVWSGSSASGLADNGTGSVTPGVAANGTYYWRVQAQDAAGNVSAWSSPITSFTWDDTPPATPTPSPAIASRVAAAPSFTVPYSDPQFADSGAVTFQLCADAGCSFVLQSTTQTSVASGTNATWTPSFLVDGLYYWKVTSTDTAGNQATASGSFTVDTTAPSAPSLVSPAVGARTNTTTPALTATYSDTPSGGTGTLSFQLCPQSGPCTSGSASGVLNGSNGTWTPPSALADGTYTWKVQATDAVGNVSPWSSTRSIVVDTNPPVLGSVSGPAVGAVLHTLPSLGGTFGANGDSGDSGTINAQLCADAACTSVVWSGSSASGIADNGTGSVTPSVAANGTYYWRVQAQDAAGNQSAWSTIGEFAFDTTPPSMPTPSAPADGVRLNQPPSLSATYVDPSAGAGESGTITYEICPTSSCTTPLVTRTSGSLVSGDSDSWATSLGDGTYYWRVAAQDAAGNGSAWSATRSFTVDQTPPNAPELAIAPRKRVRTSPALTASVSDPSDPGDSARIFVEVCADPGCASVLASGYSGTVADGTLAGWQAPALADGTYYWRAFAEDAVGNQSGWSATRSFLVDDSAPAVPVASGASEGAVVNKIQLAGVFSGSDPGETGTLEFELCTDEACTSVVVGGSAGPVASGGRVVWTADAAALEDGVYFWRVRAKDAAGNVSPWSPTRSLTLDDTPPGPPQDFRARISGRTLTLTWRPPVRSSTVHGYALIVNGRKTKTLTAKTRRIRIHLRRNDRRTFAIAAVDRAGNLSDATRTVEMVGPRLSVKGTRTPAAFHHR